MVRDYPPDVRNGYWYQPVHAKSVSAQEIRALLTARKLIQSKLLDVECGMRGFGLKVGPSCQRSHNLSG